MHKGACFECPAQGTDCAEAGATLGRLPVLKQWWRPGDEYAQVSLCYTAGACRGGTNVSAYCSEGHAGAWCDGCQKDHYRATDLSCKKCGDTHVTAQGAVILAVIGIAVIALVACAICKVRKDQRKRGTATLKHSRRRKKAKNAFDKMKDGVGNKYACDEPSR